MSNIRKFGLVLGIIAFIFLVYSPFFHENLVASNLLASAFLIVVFWIFEVIPLSLTAILPFILFPLLGIMKADETASYYFNSTIFLFLGGFLMAAAIEKSNLHKRISLIIIHRIGHSTDLIILGFMVATAFLSMFISNSATALMMLPIGLSVVKKIEDKVDKENSKKIAIALMLSIAYSASIGGIGTLIGTAPNLAFKRIYEQSFPNAPEITFTAWMIFAFPVAVLMLIITWLILTKLMYRVNDTHVIDQEVTKTELNQMGKLTYKEKVVATITTFAAFLWIFRVDLNLGFISIPGWSSFLSYSKFIDDGTIAMFIAMLLMVFPSTPLFGKNSKRAKEENKYSEGVILPISALNEVPWDILILLGGGFALAQGFQVTGFSKILGDSLAGISSYNNVVIVIAVCLLLTFLTELTSNTATTNTILPIIAGISIATGINPLLMMIPATISASFAFMLPVATPPNSIVFSSGHINIRDMVKVGFLLNIAGVIVVTIVTFTIGKILFNF